MSATRTKGLQRPAFSPAKPATVVKEPAPLPRGGRHPLTQQAVTASQRQRMLDAIGQVAATKGYGATTVADVIAHAGVSRRTFYEQFPKLEDCFLAAYEAGMQELFAAIRQALRDLPSDDWRVRTRTAISAYLTALASMPGATWAFTIEAQAAGRAALEQRSHVLRQWVTQWRGLVSMRERNEPDTPPIDDLQLLALVGGIEELVRECLRQDGPQRLPALVEPVTAFALAVLRS